MKKTIDKSAGAKLQDMRPHAEDAANLLTALGNPTRLTILCTLAEGERSVGELNACVPLSQSALSQQLARLRHDKLVTTRRESQTIYYSLNPGPADRIIQVLHDIYCGSGPGESWLGRGLARAP